VPGSEQIVFFGSPPFAVASLDAVRRSGRRICAVVTQPDRPAGRGNLLKPPAVKEYAEANGLRILQPPRMKDPTFHGEIASAGTRIFVVAAFGRLLPRAILDLADVTLNVHASLLPRWRGAAPIERAILAGDPVTGVSIMRLVEELDAGDVMLSRSTPIGPDETAGELEARLADLGAGLLVEALDRLDDGIASFAPQDPAAVTFAPPLRSEEGRIGWDRTVREVHDRVRGLSPWPGTFTTDGRHRIKIHRTAPAEPGPAGPSGSLRIAGGRLFVACSDGWIEIRELQREGRTRQAAAAFLAGYRPPQEGLFR
jgi:methionyl-tRNA formyltransferase